MKPDRAPLNESQEHARRQLVSLCRAVLAEELSFFEAAIQITRLRQSVGVPEGDSDLMAFVAIASESDHLPPHHIQNRWSPEALKKFQPEFERIEAWAKPFATEACQNIVGRFGSA
ncbi:DUF2489 domain-containing protein [Niveibacterium sp. COAC-50]|uniref:DUF2489 domain-containing protein n=1 Tax=Niveibacterium sp. COAC-50 TaxID=2729384 RepID=UPI00155702CE|nr:DUF2489 domain-containing protein [Niveibacterium sp. COAC-50]